MFELTKAKIANRMKPVNMASSNDNRTVGEIIRDARIAAKVGLRQLAKKLSIAPSYLSDIECDRRVPSEQVLRGAAVELKLDFDDLMARAGRFGKSADRYFKRNPMAGALFRSISEENLSEEALRDLQREVNDLVKKKRKERRE